METTSRTLPLFDRRTVLVGAAVGLLVAACGGQPDKSVNDSPRPLTGAEAELLALTRFRLHERELVPVDMSWPGSPSASIQATLDLHQGIGWGHMRSGSSDDAEEFNRFIAWTPTAMATAEAQKDATTAPDRAQWSSRAISTQNPQDIFLSLALALGMDRPENPVLLRQGTARYLRQDEVHGIKVAVMQGPRPAGDTSNSRSRYWVDADGGLQRFEAFLGDAKRRFASVTMTSKQVTVKGLAEMAASVTQLDGQPATD